jgi:DNA-nicking Smr family endonuclease
MPRSSATIGAALKAKRAKPPPRVDEAREQQAPRREDRGFAATVVGARPIAPAKSQRVPPAEHTAPLGVARSPAVTFDVEWSPDGFIGAVRTGEPRDALSELRKLATARDAVLDLHGLRARDAARAIDTFVRKMHERGAPRVLIVHGKGIHSTGMAVLAERSVEVLTEGRTKHLIAALVSAPPSLGGKGALVVALTGPAWPAS